MSIRKVNFVAGEYYHIYNRGNSKKKIFHDNQDYNHFLDLLYLLNTKQNLNIFHMKRNESFSVYETDINNKLVSIGAYCVMPNHFHILITQIEDDGITKFLQKVSTAYVMYYNKKYGRTGSLFEGKFKSEHVGNDRYLKYLYSYIHLNPIKLINNKWKAEGIRDKNKTIEFLNKYKYSSYQDYLGEDRPQNKILNINYFPKYFYSKKDFIREIFEWISFKDA